MSRAEFTLKTETYRRARQRAVDLDLSFSEYVRRLVASDLATPQRKVDVTCVFDLGSSAVSNIARNKDAMMAEAFHSGNKQ